MASIYGRAKAANALLGLGAFVDMQTKQKRETALHLAAYNGHADVCKVLLEGQCNTTLVNEYNETAFQAASANKQDECASLITEAAKTQ